MKIGEVAARLGVATHVLRHWEDAGVVVPDRTPSGHRDYGDEHLRRLQIVQSCQAVGLRLAEIRLVLHHGEQGRETVIDRHLETIRRQRAELATAETFLEHVRSCRHDLVTRCAACSAYAQPQRPDRGAAAEV